MRMRPRLPQNEEWPGIVDELLEGSQSARAAARALMWEEVIHFITGCVELPLPPLNDDTDARYDIAVSVMEDLERKDYERIRVWRADLRERRHSRRWWTLIETMAWWISLDFVLGRRRNLAREGNTFSWVNVLPMDPSAVVALIDAKTLSFLQSHDEDDLRGYLATLQYTHFAEDPSSEPDIDEPTTNGASKEASNGAPTKEDPPRKRR